MALGSFGSNLAWDALARQVHPIQAPKIECLGWISRLDNFAIFEQTHPYVFTVLPRPSDNSNKLSKFFLNIRNKDFIEKLLSNSFYK